MQETISACKQCTYLEKPARAGWFFQQEVEAFSPSVPKRKERLRAVALIWALRLALRAPRQRDRPQTGSKCREAFPGSLDFAI